jgi:hypothetical protein
MSQDLRGYAVAGRCSRGTALCRPGGQPGPAPSLGVERGGATMIGVRTHDDVRVTDKQALRIDVSTAEWLPTVGGQVNEQQRRGLV